MSKRTIEIEDTLEENCQEAINLVREELINYLEDNDPGRCPDISKLDYSGTIHEIIDSCVPIRTKEIKDTWYLYASELEQAYSNAGVGDNPLENDGMSAIYFYIQEEVNEWWGDNAEDIFDEYSEYIDAKNWLEENEFEVVEGNKMFTATKGEDKMTSTLDKWPAYVALKEWAESLPEPGADEEGGE